MNKQSRVKAVLFPVLSALIGIFLTLLILEIVVRFLPVVSGLYVEQPINAQQPVLRFLPNREFTYSRGWNLRGVNTGRTNNFGFINDQDYDPGATSPLAAVIGDSYVEALMIPFKNTLHASLAESARGRGRVYSFGMSGAPLSQYLAWALWVKKVFHPDLLVVTIVGNDFDESLLRYKNAPGFHYFDDSREDMPLTRVDLGHGSIYLSRKSALVRYIRDNVGLTAIIQNFRSPPNVIQYVGNVPASVEADRIERSKRAVDTFLARLSQETGIPASRIILVVDGMRPNLYTVEELRKAQGSYFDTMRVYLLARAQKLGYVVIDMQPRFIERHRATGERFEYPDDGHWNAAGHAMAAEAIKATRPFQELFGL
jgi:lysophospholipase L1-like esterase